MKFWQIAIFDDFNVLINIFHALKIFKLWSIYKWLQHWLYIVVNGILKYILDTFLRYVICSTSHMYFIRFLCPSSLCRYLNTLFLKGSSWIRTRSWVHVRCSIYPLSTEQTNHSTKLVFKVFHAVSHLNVCQRRKLILKLKVVCSIQNTLTN